VHLNIFIS